MATLRICDMCGRPIGKLQKVYRLNTDAVMNRGDPPLTVPQQQLCVHDELCEECMKRLVSYYRSYQRGVR